MTKNLGKIDICRRALQDLRLEREMMQRVVESLGNPAHITEDFLNGYMSRINENIVISHLLTKRLEELNND